MKKIKNFWKLIFYMVISLMLLAFSIIIAWLIQRMLMPKLGLCDSTAGEVASMVQGVVAAIAAGLVLYQLRKDEELNERQTNVEEAQFILEYNRSFIESEKMTSMERYMECMLTGVDPVEGINLVQNRQDMINYLVYLEGLASCIHGGILDLDKIDNVFAYRFFLAMNHPEVQSIDLLPYATYYRGCFLLYDKWLTYRMNSSKYNYNNYWDIPLHESALCYQYGYEKYATPEITTNVTANSVTVMISQRERGKLSWEKNGKVTVSIPEKHLSKSERFRTIQKNKLLRAMLKELLYNTLLYEENAKKVIPELLRSGKDPMFNLNNIYVCELNEEVVGLLLWHEGTLKWSSAELCKVMHQQSKMPPSKLNEVENEYISGYSKVENSEIISILNLCVAKHMQRNNIGTKMLTAFLSEHKGKAVELCVLSENQIAINLYTSCGFQQYGAKEPAYPKSKANHTRVTMRHYDGK